MKIVWKKAVHVVVESNNKLVEKNAQRKQKLKLKYITTHRSCFRLVLFVQFQMKCDCIAVWFSKLKLELELKLMSAWTCHTLPHNVLLFLFLLLLLLLLNVDVYREQGCLPKFMRHVPFDFDSVVLYRKCAGVFRMLVHSTCSPFSTKWKWIKCRCMDSFWCTI